MEVTRLLKHLCAPHWLANRRFPRATLAAIEAAIAASERSHDGELRFAVEGALHPAAVWRGLGARARAEELFAQLRVWDTARNSGVLVYVQTVDRRIEIVADRGLAAHVAQAEWDAICGRMEAAFRAGRFAAGALAAIDEITALLARHFPPRDGNPNELPDAPVML